MLLFERIKLIFGLLLLSFFAFGQNNDSPISHCGKSDSYVSYNKLLHYSNPLTENYDLKYYRFNWFIDPAEYYIKGSATPYFQVLEDNFSEIYFDFSNHFTVDSIIFHEKKITYSQPSDYVLKIDLPDKLAKGNIDSLSIFYQGVPPNSGFGSFIQGTHGGGMPVLWTLSEPFGAQDWWPCKNGLSDKIDSLDIFVTTPNNYRAASNGILVSEIELLNSQKEYHWRHRHPIAAYLIAIAVTDYTVYTHDILLQNGTVMPMINYVYPESLEDAKEGTLNNVKVLQYFDSLFVTYPFHDEKYGHAQFGWGGGMEHQTMSYVVNFGWGLLAHELAHQWFGDHVTCGSWNDIWLNEGFATYLDGLTREHFFTPLDWYNWKASMINSITSRPDGSVKVPDSTNVNRIFSSRLSYNKASYLLHMLRWKLGDEVFFKGVRNYLKDRGGKYALTFHLKNELEAISGENLDEFFKDWYEGEGYPFYDVRWDQLPDKKVRIQLFQTTSHPSVDFFDIPVHIRLKDGNQEFNIRLDSFISGKIYEFEPGFDVKTVQFDPELWIISKSTVSNEIILNRKVNPNFSVKCYPNPVSTILTIEVVKSNALDLDMQIIDNEGKIIQTQLLKLQKSTIDIRDLTPGTYQLIIKDKNEIVNNTGFIKI